MSVSQPHSHSLACIHNTQPMLPVSAAAAASPTSATQQPNTLPTPTHLELMLPCRQLQCGRPHITLTPCQGRRCSCVPCAQLWWPPHHFEVLPKGSCVGGCEFDHCCAACCLNQLRLGVVLLIILWWMNAGVCKRGGWAGGGGVRVRVRESVKGGSLCLLALCDCAVLLLLCRCCCDTTPNTAAS
jgi:hypothetical protein